MTQETLEKKVNPTIRYSPISPEAGYNREEFLMKEGELLDFSEYRNLQDKEPHNSGNRRDHCGLIFGNKDFEINMPPEQLIATTKRLHDESRNYMAEFVKNHLGTFLGDLKGESLYQLVMAMPIYKTGNRKHNEAVDAINELKEVIALENEGNMGKITNYTLESIKNGNLSDAMKKSLFALSGNSTVIERLFRGEVAMRHIRIAELGLKRDDKYDDNKLRALIEDSIDEAEEARDDEDVKEDKYDIFKNDLRPCYLEIARHAYPALIKKHEKDTGRDKDNEYIERAERAEERRSKGMRF